MQLGQDDIGDVSLVGPVILLFGALAIGGIFFYLTKKQDDHESDNDAVNRVKNVIEDIESDTKEVEEDL